MRKTHRKAGPRPRPEAQASLEYLLLLCAFFSALAIALPSITFSVQQFLGASDAVLAKSIASQIQEQDSLFRFLADGSAVSLEFVPAKGISIYSKGNEIVVAGGEREFRAALSSAQVIPKQDFSKKFFVSISKSAGQTRISLASQST